MPLDFRVLTTYPNHLKTLQLRDELGDGAAFNLVAMWAWCRENRPDGIFTEVGDRHVEIVSGWKGESGAFIKALLQPLVPGGAGFLERRPDGILFCHDWAEHQPFSMGDAEFKNAAREMGKASGESRRKKAEARRQNSRNGERSGIDDKGEEKSAETQALNVPRTFGFSPEKSAERRHQNRERSELPPSHTTPPKPHTTPPRPRTPEGGTRTHEIACETAAATSGPCVLDSPDRPVEISEQSSPGNGAIDRSIGALVIASGWQSFVTDEPRRTPDFKRLVQELKPVGIYRDTGKSVYAVESREKREAVKRVLAEAGGAELQAAIVITVERNS